MQPDVVMVGTVLSQKDCGLALPAAVSVLVLLVASVHEPRAAEQCATHIALGNVPMPQQQLVLQCVSVVCAVHHVHTGAATFSISHKQGCVAAVEVVDLLSQLSNLTLVLVSCCLSMFDSIEGVDTGGQICA